MKKRLLTMIFAFAALASWAQTVEAPTFTFDGDNLVMTTGTATASVFYGIADLTDLQDATITATTRTRTGPRTAATSTADGSTGPTRNSALSGRRGS